MIYRLLKISILSAVIATVFWGCSGKEAAPVIPDTTPPTVVSTSPAAGSTNVGVDVAISATFSEEMDRWTFTPQTFAVGGAGSGNILYKDKTVSFTPSAKLGFNQEYTVVITTDVSDVAGNNLAAIYNWTFTTTPGTIMPLKIGNQWEFLVEQRDTITNLIDTGYQIIEIVRDTMIGSERWLVSQSGDKYINKGDGLWMLSVSKAPYLFLKFPASPGDTYFANPDRVETIRVDSIATSRSVPHGTHICHKYSGTVPDPTFKYRYYYKPNFGPVAYEKVTVGSSKVVERWSLIRLKLL